MQLQEPSIHPFAQAHDATVPILPPVPVHPTTTPQLLTSKCMEAAYCTVPPIYDKKFTEQVFELALETPITITHCQLYSVAPEVHSQTHKVLMGCYVPPADSIKATETQLLIANEDTAGDALLLCKEIHEVATEHKYTQLVQNMPEEYTMAEARMKWEIANRNRLIIPDPYETYLCNLPVGQSPNSLTVAKESSLLHSILLLVDNRLHIECIINPSCQVIVISENICHTLGLPYDPDITLNMQLTNGKIDKSLGLSCNIPFHFGEVTIYLQVHVIHSPAYDILLR